MSGETSTAAGSRILQALPALSGTRIIRAKHPKRLDRDAEGGFGEGLLAAGLVRHATEEVSVICYAVVERWAPAGRNGETITRSIEPVVASGVPAKQPIPLPAAHYIALVQPDEEFDYGEDGNPEDWQTTLITRGIREAWERLR